MYNDELRNKALQLLIVQIKQGQVQALIAALSRWHLIEVELLLPEIVDRIIPIRRQPWGRDRLPRVIQEHVLPDLTIVSRAPDSSAPLKKTIREASAKDKAFCTAYKQSFGPLLSFLSRVAEIHTGTCKAVLQAGYLDILLAAQKKASGIENIADLFKVVLSQPRLLTPIIREKVLNLIVNEVLQNRIEHIVVALAKWSVDDVQVLMMELEGNTTFNRALSKYSGTPSPFEQNVTFLFRIAEIGKPYLHAILNAGFLNILQIAQEQQFPLEDNKFFTVVFEVLKANSDLKTYRSKALDLLVESILRRKTTHILSTLAKWEIQDLEDIIVAIFRRAGPVGFGAEGPFGPKRNAFHSRDGIYYFDQEKIVSVMTFAGKIARLSEEAFQAVIRAGILDALLVIQSHDLSVHGLDENFNIILEVLRPGSYANKVRKQALDLLVFQVCRGEARYMLKIMSKWSISELNRVIWEISSQFPHMSNHRALEDLFTRPQETQTL
ncbi:hypothetical protein GALMADRAFT_712055 [Galerina marginata CBS 339.88]|uniref:Uncharacterized protein n=1 Tax=Galerina marginata (strain CBS 339.88) TaxID=685588 RepID=A0A067TWS7_GALM3|nr:hypothetical protein GALMADRAFT_712055 [Galerina marginata CBS 339.88]